MTLPRRLLPLAASAWLIAIALVFAASGASAQERLSASVLGNGGQRLAGDNAIAQVTLGQGAIGIAAAGADVVHAGFWYIPGTFIVAREEPAAVPAHPDMIAAWPNPASSHLYVTIGLPREQLARLELCDALGRVLCVAAAGRYPSGASTVVMDIGRIPRGCAFLLLHAGGTTTTRAVLLR